MVAIVISICSSIIAGILRCSSVAFGLRPRLRVLFLMQKFFKKKDKKDEIRDEIKARENILILKSINAVGKLTEANSIALRDGKTNGLC